MCKQERVKRCTLALLSLIAISLEVYFHAINDVDIIYTHFFYIPIFLACIWYGYRSLYLVALLGGLHIFIGFSQGDMFDPFLRVALMTGVSLIISYLVTWQGCMEEDIDILQKQSRETIKALRELTETLIQNENAGNS